MAIKFLSTAAHSAGERAAQRGGDFFDRPGTGKADGREHDRGVTWRKYRHQRRKKSDRAIKRQSDKTTQR